MMLIVLRTLTCLAAFVLFCGSCSNVANSAFLGSTSAAAKDHIMFVRQNPPTFGFQRLTALTVRYPDLGIFIDQQGLPDCLAETNKSGNRYLILYYLESRKAFACRSGSGNSRQVEFSGPYPITENEHTTLSELRGTSD